MNPSRWKRPVTLAISTPTKSRNASRCFQPNRFDPCDSLVALVSPTSFKTSLLAYSTCPLPCRDQVYPPCRGLYRVSGRSRHYSTTTTVSTSEPLEHGSHPISVSTTTSVLTSEPLQQGSHPISVPSAPVRTSYEAVDSSLDTVTQQLDRELEDSISRASATAGLTSLPLKPEIRHIRRRRRRSPRWIGDDPAKTKQAIQYREQKKWQWLILRQRCHGQKLITAQNEFWKWAHAYMSCVIHGRDLGPGRPPSADWLYSLDTIQEMRAAWEALDVHERRERWPMVMLSTMESSPAKTRKVLAATADLDYPGYVIQDCLFFIASRLDLSSIKSRSFRSVRSSRVMDLLADILQRFHRRHVPFHDYICAAFVRKLPPAQVKDLYSVMKQTKRRLRTNTTLHFISKLARTQEYKATAFGMFKEVLTNGKEQINLNEAKFASVITTLLMRYDSDETPKETEGDDFSSSDALQFFMERGYTPNIITLTALLTDLGRKGEFDEATRLTALFIEAGVVLDEKVVKLIIRNAKASLSSENVIKALKVPQVINASKVDACNNALHSVFVFATAESRADYALKSIIPPLFPTLLRLYGRRFDLEELQQWIPETLGLLMNYPLHEAEGPVPKHWEFEQTIAPDVDGFLSQWEGPLLRPDTTTLTIMLRAYTKSIESAQDLVTFYTFFKTRCQEHGLKHPLVRQMLHGDNTALLDTLILSMIDREGMARIALQVFGDMLSPHSSGGKPPVVAPASSQPFFPRPSIFTYTITLRGLFDRGEVALAEEVVRSMRDAGVDLTLPAYNTIIRGYAGRQDMAMTVRTMQELEMAGFAPDDRTMKAFGRLLDQEGAFKMMEKIIEKNRDELEKGSWAPYL